MTSSDRARSPRLWLALLLSTALLWVAPPATAIPAVLKQAKADGVIGEQANGYLGFVKGSGPADVKQAMDELNAKRRKLYEQRAAKQGTDAKTYGAVVGRKQIAKEPKGVFVKGDQGWVKK